MRTIAAEPPTPLPPTRDRIIVAELPHHRDHLALALAASLMVALAGALVIVLLPRPPNDVRFLERARTIRTLAIQERERRRTMKPLVVAIDSHRRPARDPLMWTPGSSVAEAIRAREARADERADERAGDASCDVSFAPDEYGWDVIIEARGASPSSSGAPRAPAFICRAPDRASARVWFQEHVQPVLHECMHEHMPPREVTSAVTLAFDDAGRVAHASFAELVHTSATQLDPSELDIPSVDEMNAESEAFLACAHPRLAELAWPDAFELTFTWPFARLP